MSDLTSKIIEIASEVQSVKDQEYAVIITLFTDKIQEDGGRGTYFIVGTYPKIKTCKKVKETLVNEYGLQADNVNIIETCHWNPLGLPVDINKEADDKKGKNGTDGKQGHIDEDSEINEYIYKIYLTIKNKLHIDTLKKELVEYENKFSESVHDLKNRDKVSPHLRESWIPILSKKMSENGEHDALKQILDEYKNLNIK